MPHNHVPSFHRHGPSATRESDMLFFDSESRALRASDDVQEESQRAGLMQLMVAQCARLNDLQTRTVAPFATAKEQPTPKDPASQPDLIVRPRDSEEMCTVCLYARVCAHLCTYVFVDVYYYFHAGGERRGAPASNQSQ